MAIFCFAFLFVVLFVLSRTTRSIDELVKQRLIAIEEFKKVQAAFDELAPTASVAGLPSTISAGGDRTTIDSVQRLQNQSSETEQKELRPGNAIRTRLAVLQGSIVDDKARSARLASAAARIRDQEYSIRQFFEDMVYAFPELDLYLPIEVSEAVNSPSDRLENHMKILRGQPFIGVKRDSWDSSRTSSGNNTCDEYRRTIGALFCVYWLVRMDIPGVPGSEGLDGKLGFCFGVDTNSWRSRGEPAGEDAKAADKRRQFLQKQDWQGFHQLVVDSGLITPAAEGSAKVNTELMIAMLTLTAVHDVMKITGLLPRVHAEHGPFLGFAEGEEIGDHDIALAYVLECDADAIPCYFNLEEAQRAPVRFTQAKLGFNHGWLVQAEAPPGALFNTFKSVLESGSVSSSMIAFYFVHWLTDLGGAVPTPLEGAVKLVVQFPLAVLASFIRSFPLVQRLSDLSQTELMEQCLCDWWPSELGPVPTGHDAVAKMRLVVQAQSEQVQREVMASFQHLVPTERHVLALEMARTGIDGQSYSTSPQPGGPAFLVYYSPAFLRESVEGVPFALSVLAAVYQAARNLFPLSDDSIESGRSVTVRIDKLKGCGDARSVIALCNEGFTWILKRVSNQEAEVQYVSEVELCHALGSDYTGSIQILNVWAAIASALYTSEGREHMASTVEESESSITERNLFGKSTRVAPG